MHFPEVTVHFDLHGVENGNLSMIQGKTTITGTGYSIRTGEVFTLDYRYKENEIDLFTSVDVTTVRVKTIAIGSQGSVYITTFRYHVTWNANNEMTAYVERGTEDCN